MDRVGSLLKGRQCGWPSLQACPPKRLAQVGSWRVRGGLLVLLAVLVFFSPPLLVRRNLESLLMTPTRVGQLD